MVSIAYLAEFQVCKNVVGMLVQGGLVTGHKRDPRELRYDQVL